MNLNERIYVFVPNEGLFWRTGRAKSAEAELESAGKTIMVAYGGGSVRRAQSAVYHDGSGETGDFRRV